MKKSLIAVAALGTLLAGCQTTSQNQPVYGWMRADLKRITGNPQLEQQAELDKKICLGETQKSAVGMAPIYHNGSIGGAINAAIIENQRGSALKDVAEGCMAQRGYIRVTKEEGEARIAAAEATHKKRR